LWGKGKRKTERGAKTLRELLEGLCDLHLCAKTKTEGGKGKKTNAKAKSGKKGSTGAARRSGEKKMGEKLEGIAEKKSRTNRTYWGFV